MTASVQVESTVTTQDALTSSSPNMLNAVSCAASKKVFIHLTTCELYPLIDLCPLIHLSMDVYQLDLTNLTLCTCAHISGQTQFKFCVNTTNRKSQTTILLQTEEVLKQKLQSTGECGSSWNNVIDTQSGFTYAMCIYTIYCMYVALMVCVDASTEVDQWFGSNQQIQFQLALNLQSVVQSLKKQWSINCFEVKLNSAHASETKVTQHVAFGSY